MVRGDVAGGSQHQSCNMCINPVENKLYVCLVALHFLQWIILVRLILRTISFTLKCFDDTLHDLSSVFYCYKLLFRRFTYFVKILNYKQGHGEG